MSQKTLLTLIAWMAIVPLAAFQISRTLSTSPLFERLRAMIEAVYGTGSLPHQLATCQECQAHWICLGFMIIFPHNILPELFWIPVTVHISVAQFIATIAIWAATVGATVKIWIRK